MPIPLILAAVAGAVGIGGHLSAKDKNEQAQRVSIDAQNLYDDAKASLERSKRKTESSLLALGYKKKNILETSMNQFLRSYNKIKEIQFRESVGLNEISKFTIDKQGALEIQRMTDIYSDSFKSGAAGAATGAVIALAASGALPVVTGTLATAGTAVVAGEIGAAAGLAGSALSFGAAMTPLSAIAAPVVLFTGISASMKADDNLEKANTMYSKARAAAEQMRVSETLCNAISDRADMFDSLLMNLDSMFSECSGLLEGLIRKKEGVVFKKKLTSDDFTEDEIKLIAVTRAVAGAVKSVIDTPMLSNDGELSYESWDVYQTTASEIPQMQIEVQNAKSNISGVKSISAKPAKTTTHSYTQPQSSSMPVKVRNVFALLIGVVLSVLFAESIATILTKSNEKFIFINAFVVNRVALWLVFCASTTMTIGKYLSEFSKKACKFSDVVGLSILYVQFCRRVINMNHYMIFSFALIIALIILFGIFYEKNEFAANQCLAIGLVPCAFLIFAFLSRFIGFSSPFCLVLTTLLFSFFAGVTVFTDLDS